MICQRRFTAFVEEAQVFNVSRLDAPGTLFVTALRDPVRRIKSSYKFEGEGTFADYVHKLQRERQGGRAGRIWMECQNYYVQRLSGYRWKGAGPKWPEGRSGADPTAPDWAGLYARALAVLQAFDVVFIVEEMDHHETMRRAAAQMGILALGGTGNRTAAASGGGGVAELGHDRLPRYTRGPAPKLALTADEEAALVEWNSWDTKLFEAAKARAAAEHQSRRFSGIEGAPPPRVPAPSSFGLRRCLPYGSSPAVTRPSSAPSPFRRAGRGEELPSVPASHCVADIASKWGEPIERLRARLPCSKHKRRAGGAHRKERRSKRRRR